MKAGAIEFLTKPFDTDVLLKCIETAIDTSETGLALEADLESIRTRFESLSRREREVGGPPATRLSPRVGHLHITLDDLPWQWADYGQSNTIILVNLPGGEHKVLIEVVDPEGKLLTTQHVRFAVPEK